MNKRIQELRKQAGSFGGAEVKEMLQGSNIYDQALERYMERFAELIVGECIDVCKSRVGNSDYNTGRMHCVSDLKEHFGVE